MTATEQWIFLCAAHKTPKEVRLVFTVLIITCMDNFHMYESLSLICLALCEENIMILYVFLVYLSFVAASSAVPCH